MSLVKRSLAGVDEFEDSDTKNRFYRWRDIKAEAERLDNEEDQEITYDAASLYRLGSSRARRGTVSVLRVATCVRRGGHGDGVERATRTRDHQNAIDATVDRESLVTTRHYHATQVHAGGRL